MSLQSAEQVRTEGKQPCLCWLLKSNRRAHSLNMCQGLVPLRSAERVFTEGKLVVLVLFEKT